MNKVYAVGCMQIDTAENAVKDLKSQRLWGLFASLEAAQQYVIENRGDIFERYYNYALIEELHLWDTPSDDGEHHYVPKEWWFHATFPNANDQDDWNHAEVTPCDKPKCLDRIVCFWAG